MSTKPPNPPSITLSTLLTPLLTLVLGIILAKHHSGHLHHLTQPIKLLLPQCPPTKICPLFYRRPTLPSGQPATRIFDVPRRHLHSNYSALSSIAPNTKLVLQWRSPRVVVFDGGFGDLVDNLITLTTGKFLATTVVNDDGVDVVDHNRRSDTAFVSPHREKQPLNEMTDKLIQLIGLPNRHYSEVIEVNRYNESGFFAIHYDFLSEAGMLDKGPFRGCQRIATAVLQMSDVQGGDTVFVADENFKGGFDDIDQGSEHVLIVPAKKGRLVAWFNVHPDTEEVDKRTWHGSMPVKNGQKLAATFYLRNCSQADNSRKKALVEKFMKDAPAPSAGVSKERNNDDDDDDDDDDGDDDGDDDDDDDDDDYGPEDDVEYLKNLRQYRKIRDAGGNSAQELIKAGYSPEDFADLDQEVLMLDDLEEDMEEKLELERLRLYKEIKEKGGNFLERLKEAGFDEEDFPILDKEVEYFADELENTAVDEDENEKGDDFGSMNSEAGGRGGGTDLDHAAGDDDQADKTDDNQRDGIEHGKGELGMDAESIQSFEERLREEQLAKDRTDGTADPPGDVDAEADDTEESKTTGIRREEEELGMDEESIRDFEHELREAQLADSDEVEDLKDEDGQCEGGFDEGDDDAEEEQYGEDDDDDFLEDDFDFLEEEYEADEDWDDDNGEWDMFEDDEMGAREDGKVIPPGSVADEVKAR